MGGFLPFSTLDYPGRLAAVVFCQGCGWRCRYCQNPHLVPKAEGTVPWQTVTEHLRERRGFLEAVVFSGGEPTLQPQLVACVQEARQMGYLVGLHTSGQSPARLAQVLPHLDWVGIDAKHLPHRLWTVSRGALGHLAEESLRHVVSSGVLYEVRTTVHPLLHPDPDLVEMASWLRGLGVRHWRVQRFRATGCEDAELCGCEAGLAIPDDLGAGFSSFEVR